jgi:RNA polymerase sigma factor (sigma-70 family)
VRDDPTVVDLVERARRGDKGAWEEIVERYAPLIWATCRRYGLEGAQAHDVGASTWLRLVERLDTLREPAALPGWLATTAQRECLRLLRTSNRMIPTDDQAAPAGDDAGDHDRWLLREERHIALRAAFSELSERCRELLGMLFADPPHPYTEICAAMGVAMGAVGPMRQRCLERLRRSRALAAFDEPSPVEAG